MWVDVTQAFGSKWKAFFRELEEFHGLNPSREGHIWLLHHLFLHQIDEDAQEFVSAWNNHKMQIRGARSASPREMFFFGMAENGPRGFEDISNVQAYGVDWEDYTDAQFMRGLQEANPANTGDVHVFQAPEHIAIVNCEPPNCPLTAAELVHLNTEVRRRVGGGFESRDMTARRAVWQVALDVTTSIINNA
jgi:hypothetical protein